jgi:hypothetical protein
MSLFQLGGCAAIRSHWPFQSQLPPAASTSSHVHRQAPSAISIERPNKEESGTERTAATRKAPATASIPPAKTPPAGTTNVTLEDNDADHLRAQALLDNADTRLAKIDRSKLTGENATAYDQASELAKAARDAMVQHDYLAASGLARKAALVTAQVAARTSSR